MPENDVKVVLVRVHWPTPPCNILTHLAAAQAVNWHINSANITTLWTDGMFRICLLCIYTSRYTSQYNPSCIIHTCQSACYRSALHSITVNVLTAVCTQVIVVTFVCTWHNVLMVVLQSPFTEHVGVVAAVQCCM